METIGSAVFIIYLPMLLDLLALKDLGKYNLNIQVIQAIAIGTLCTPEIFEKVRDGFQRLGFDEPELLSAYGLNELGKNL